MRTWSIHFAPWAYRTTLVHRQRETVWYVALRVYSPSCSVECLCVLIVCGYCVSVRVQAVYCGAKISCLPVVLTRSTHKRNDRKTLYVPCLATRAQQNNNTWGKTRHVDAKRIMLFYRIWLLLFRICCMTRSCYPQSTLLGSRLLWRLWVVVDLWSIVLCRFVQLLLFSFLFFFQHSSADESHNTAK